MGIANITNNVLTDSGLDTSSFLTTSAAASTYVPYTGATSSLDVGTNDLSGRYLNAEGSGGLGGVLNIKQDAVYLPKGNGYSSIASSFTDLDFFGYTGASTYKNFTLKFDELTDNTRRRYTLPDTDGTLALTSDLGAYVTLNTTQTINGFKTFSNTIFAPNGVTIDEQVLITKSSNSGGLIVNQTGGIGNAVTITGGLLSAEAATLTGALNGTSATFSSSVTSAGNIFTTNDSVFSTAGSITKHATVGLVLRGVTAAVFDLALYSANGTAMMTNPAGSNNLNFNAGCNVGMGGTLNVTGAATFSSSVGVGGSISGNHPLTIRSTAADYTKILDWGTGVGGSWGTMTINIDAPYQTIFNSGGGFAFTGGNVGIGTAGPSYLLELAKNAEAGDGANLALYNNSYTAGGFTRIRLGRSNTREASIKVISTQDGGRNNDIVFESKRGNGGDDTTFAENMRIKAGGNIGIGIIDPTTLLDIVGSNSAELGALRIYNSAGSPGSQNSVSLLMQVKNSINNLPSVKLIAQESTNDSNLGELIVQTSNDNASNLSEVVRIAQSGAGGARFIRMASGTGGIQFNGDTAAANALDDYEEGTFTPDIRLGSWAFGARSGFYTKIGNLVTVNLLIVWTANNAPSGDSFQITLPFTAFGSGNFRAPGAIGYTAGINFNTSRQLIAHLDMANNFISFQQLVSGGNPTTLTTSEVSSSGEIQVSITYQV